MSFGARGAGGTPPIGAETVLHYAPAALPVRLMGGLWDNQDGRIALIADFPRLFAVIGQAHKRPGDTYNEATHFRFPDGSIFRQGAFHTPWTHVPSVWPLDDVAGAVAAAFGKTNLPTTGPGYQSFTWTHTGGVATALAARNAADALAWANLPAHDNTKFTAGQLNITACDAGYTAAITLLIYKLDNTNAVTGFARVGHAGTPGAITPCVEIGGGGFTYGAALAQPRVGSIGFYIHHGTDNVGWTLNGVDQGYITPFFKVTAGEHFGVIVAIDDDAGCTGSVTGEWVSDAQYFTEPFPTPTVDINGNAYSVPLPTSNVGTRLGADIVVPDADPTHIVEVATVAPGTGTLVNTSAHTHINNPLHTFALRLIRVA